jgi:deazaflavin-dependent oxidoreductase (nitroreductase family)
VSDDWLAARADEPYCYLTTRGRVTGRPHEIEIWFGVVGASAYLLSGGRERADWVRNIVRDPHVSIRIAGDTREATARLVEPGEEDRAARHALASKYQGWREGVPLSDWARTALPVAIDL